jgi:hypothetical protein
MRGFNADQRPNETVADSPNPLRHLRLFALQFLSLRFARSSSILTSKWVMSVYPNPWRCASGIQSWLP